MKAEITISPISNKHMVGVDSEVSFALMRLCFLRSSRRD